MVTSRETADCHSSAAPPTRTTAPIVKDAKKVMMAITTTSARPAIESTGTMGLSARGPGSSGRSSDSLVSMSTGRASFIVVQPPFVQHQPPGIELIHQRDVVRSDHHRRSRPVELDEQPQQTLGQRRVHVASR